MRVLSWCIQGRLGHPDVLAWNAAVLWSINDRLGGGEGLDLEPMDHKRMVQDTIDAMLLKARQGGDTLEEVLDDYD